MPPEIWQMILDYCDFLSKIRLRQICKSLYVHMRIVDFYNIEDKYVENLNDDILKQHSYIKYLNAFDNANITDVNHLEHLEILDASWNCGIHSSGIKKINPKKLDANGNPRIKNISHMNNLIELHAIADCGISDKYIENLKLKYLDAMFNNKITKIIT